jgi:hypothetical protein
VIDRLTCLRLSRSRSGYRRKIKTNKQGVSGLKPEGLGDSHSILIQYQRVPPPDLRSEAGIYPKLRTVEGRFQKGERTTSMTRYLLKYLTLSLFIFTLDREMTKSNHVQDLDLPDQVSTL